MAENENVVVTEETPAVPVNEEVVEAPVEPGKPGIGARIKEYFRKQIVSLKRSPQMIALIVLLATTIFFMLCLYPISIAAYSAAQDPHTKATGICIFITTLLSLLVLVSFLNAFPKRKKANIFFIVLVFAMIAVMIVCDIVYYLQMEDCFAHLSDKATSTIYASASPAQPYVIVHIVLLGVSAIVFALLPVYKKLINSINTSVKLESATENMQGNIDIQED